MMARRPLLPLTTIVAVLCLSACTTPVKPWERGTLAKREMAITPSPALKKLRDHVFVSKEAAQGGYGSAASGCGCN